MKRRAWALSGVAVLFAGAVVWAGQGSPDDTKALDEGLAAWVAGFNAHDAKALAATYAEDADSVTSTGELQKGRAAIEKGLVEFFGKNPNVKITLEVTSRRFIKPDVVLEDGLWEESGHTQKGLPTKGLYSSILVKRGGRWVGLCDRTMVPIKEPGTATGEKK